jgi:hypothetical protein
MNLEVLPMTAAQPDRLDRIEALIEKTAAQTDKNAVQIEKNIAAIDKLTKDIDEQRQESKELGSRFGYYQQSTQAIVNLAFSLIASATISVFITVVLKR